MFATRRSSTLAAKRISSFRTAGGTTILRQKTARTIDGQELRLLSTLLPASCFGATLHVCSLERAGNNSIIDNTSTLASHSNRDAAIKSGGWGSALYRFMSSSTSSAPTLKDEIASLVDRNKVVIFSKSYCPYCSATKKLFQRMDIEGDVVVIELDRDPRGMEIQQELQRMTGQRTVPNVFVNGTHLGGNSDAQSAAQSGKLKEMLN